MYSITRASRRFGSVILVIAFWSLPGFPAKVRVAWDAGDDAGRLGFRIYYDTSSPPRPKSPCVVVTDTNARELPKDSPVPDLIPGTTYFLAAVAYDKDGMESAPSNIIPYTPPAIYLTSPTTGNTYLTNIPTITLSGTSKGGTLEGDLPITQVTWSNSRGGGGSTQNTGNWSFTGIQLASGMNLLTVTAINSVGYSASLVLTAIYDVGEPVINILERTITDNGTLTLSGIASDTYGIDRVVWSSDQKSGSKSGTGSWTDSSLSWSFSGISLHPGVNEITLTAWDLAGNVTSQTITVNNDPSALAISGVTVIEVNSTSVQICWTTNLPSDSQVDYGPSVPYTRQSPIDSKLVTSHTVLLSGLEPGSTYHYCVRSKTAVSEDNQFTLGTRKSTLFFPYLFTSVHPTDTPAGSPANASRKLAADATDPQNVGVALTNLSDSPATLTFMAFDPDGVLVSGPGIVNPASLPVPSGTDLVIPVSDLFGFSSSEQPPGGSIRVQSDVDSVKGMFLIYDNNLTGHDGANVSSRSMSSFVLPETATQGLTKVNITNADSSNVAELDLELRAKDGTIRETQKVYIAPGGSLIKDVYGGIFSVAAGDGSDYIRGSSSLGLVPYEMVGNAGPDMAILSGLDLSRSSTLLYAPQYAVGGPWLTTLSIVNMVSLKANASLQLFDENGRLIGERDDVSIEGFGKLYIEDPSYFGSFGQELVQGYVKVTSDRPLAGSIRFSQSGSAGFTTSLPLVATPQSSLFFGQVASNSDWYTCLSIVNPNGKENDVTIELYSSGGQLWYSKKVTIPALQRVIGFLTETQFFPEIKDQKFNKGYIRVESPDGVAGFVLLATHNFSVLSAIPGQ